MKIRWRLDTDALEAFRTQEQVTVPTEVQSKANNNNNNQPQKLPTTATTNTQQQPTTAKTN